MLFIHCDGCENKERKVRDLADAERNLVFWCDNCKDKVDEWETWLVDERDRIDDQYELDKEAKKQEIFGS